MQLFFPPRPVRQSCGVDFRVIRPNNSERILFIPVKDQETSSPQSGPPRIITKLNHLNSSADGKLLGIFILDFLNEL